MYWKKHPAHEAYCKAKRPKSKEVQISNAKSETLAVYYYACAVENPSSSHAKRFLQLAEKHIKEAFVEQNITMVREPT